MTVSITQRDITAHQKEVLWTSRRQVEQDLLLCLAMSALFSDDFLKKQIAMRGGTLLHKVHLAPAARYSEDIDLVVIGDRPSNHISKAIKRVLKDILGEPVKSVWEEVKLAIRNTVRPSEVLRLTYHIPSISDSGTKYLEIVVEANSTERTSYHPIAHFPLIYKFRGENIESKLNGFEIHEMLGTKMRALFQRKRGRDLFDLYWALTVAKVDIDPTGIVNTFLYYMDQEGSTAGRDEFIGILNKHLTDRSFLSDMDELLRAGVQYNPVEAGAYITNNLLSLLPDEK